MSGYTISRLIPIQRSAPLSNGHVLVHYDAVIPGPKQTRAMKVTCQCDASGYVEEHGPQETYAMMRDRAATRLSCLGQNAAAV